jgi:hypothetical protein
VIQRRELPRWLGLSLIGMNAFGREHDVVAASGQGLADEDLGLAGGVDVGGVDEGDAGVKRAVDDPDALVVVPGTPLAEHHGAQAQLADADPSAAEASLLHRHFVSSMVSGSRGLAGDACAPPAREEVEGLFGGAVGSTV